MNFTNSLWAVDIKVVIAVKLKIAKIPLAFIHATLIIVKPTGRGAAQNCKIHE